MPNSRQALPDGSLTELLAHLDRVQMSAADRAIARRNLQRADLLASAVAEAWDGIRQRLSILQRPLCPAASASRAG